MKAFYGLHHEDEEKDIAHETNDASCIDNEGEENESDRVDEGITLDNDKLFRLKQQIFTWGLVPGP